MNVYNHKIQTNILKLPNCFSLSSFLFFILASFILLHFSTRRMQLPKPPNPKKPLDPLNSCSVIDFLYHEIHMICMVAYFCPHLSDNYVDLSDLYVVLSDLYVELSDLYVDLSLIYLLENES